MSKSKWLGGVAAWLACTMCSQAANPGPGPSPARNLRLVPFPKEIELENGSLTIRPKMTIVVSNTPAAKQAALDLKDDLAALGKYECDIKTAEPGEPPQWELRFSSGEVPEDAPEAVGGLPTQNESYRLVVTPDAAIVRAKEKEGLIWGIQTLRQLVRANLKGTAMPCLSITDWPSLRYRGFQDDLTRAISSTLPTMQHEVRTGSLLKYNFWTYYMEDQYAFKKHPDIGPKGGQLKPEELKALVDYAGRYNMEIVGNQQSFGHFEKILRLPAYSHLAESSGALDPQNEGSYKLLDDLYSEVAPITNSKLFNVCCDEVWSLGTGTAKELAEKIGVGGVYTMHMKRIHDILKDKYGKRMMMWGDIILRHPENLKDIPKDTIMLSWGYDASPSFDNVLKPFADAGYDFFVCPGVNNWFRIIPFFSNAIGNIQNYVRDGVKHGALGMLLTSWDDDTSTFFNYNWHGVAWGAECSWNASTTSIEDFNSRLGAVMFGEKGDHFGKAIALLTKAHLVRGYDWLMTPRFWRKDNGEFAVSREIERKQNQDMLDLVNPALEHLKAAKEDAKFNADVLDYFIFAAERVKLLATRMDNYIDAAEACEQAGYLLAEKEDAQPLIAKAIECLEEARDEHVRLKEQCEVLWRKEAREYALDWNLGAYDGLITYYDGLISKLEDAGKTLKETGVLPPASEVGLEIVEKAVRRTRPQAVESEPLFAGAPWAEPAFKKRIGIMVESGGADRADQPIEVDLPIAAPQSRSVRLVEVSADGASQKPMLCQTQSVGDRTRLIFLAPGELPKDSKRSFFLYYDSASEKAGAALPGAVTCTDDKDGTKWVENNHYRLLLSPVGAQIFRWEVKALDNMDLTEPGETDWRAFANLMGKYRYSTYKMELLSSGPALVRLKFTDEAGNIKTISAWAGVPWVEVTFSQPVSGFWCYDNTNLIGPRSATPGTYLFSDGRTGSMTEKLGGGRVYWSAKYLAGGPIVAVITPEDNADHWVGPGGGDGGIGVGGGVAHFAIYGGVCPQSPKDTLDQVRAALNNRAQPRITLYAAQEPGVQ